LDTRRHNKPLAAVSADFSEPARKFFGVDPAMTIHCIPFSLRLGAFAREPLSAQNSKLEL